MDSPDYDLITIGGVDFSDLEDGLSEDEIINNLKKPITPAFFAKKDSQLKEKDDEKVTTNDARDSPKKPNLDPLIIPSKEEEMKNKGRWKYHNKSRFNTLPSVNSLPTRNFRNGMNRMPNGNPFDSTCHFQEYFNSLYRPPVPLFSHQCSPTIPRSLMNSNFPIRHSSNMTNQMPRNRFPLNSTGRQPFGFSSSSRASKILSLLSLPNIPLPKPSSNLPPLLTHSPIMTPSYIAPSPVPISNIGDNSSSNFTYQSPLSYLNVVGSPSSNTVPVPLISSTFPRPLINTSIRPPIINTNSACRLTQGKGSISPGKRQPFRKKTNIFSKLASSNTPPKVSSTNQFSVSSVTAVSPCSNSFPSFITSPSFISNSEISHTANSSSNILNEASLVNSVNVGEPMKSSTPVPSMSNGVIPLKIDNLNLTPIKTLSAIDPPLLSPLKTPPPPPKIGSSDDNRLDKEHIGPSSIIARLGDYVPSPNKENSKDKIDLKDVNRKLFDSSSDEELLKEDDQLGCNVLITDLEMSDDNDNNDDDDDDLLILYQSSNSKAINNDKITDNVAESVNALHNKEANAVTSSNTVFANPVNDNNVLESLKSTGSGQGSQLDVNDRVDSIESPAKEFTRTAFPTIFRIANLAGDTKNGNGYLSNINNKIWLKKDDHDMTSIDCQVIISNLPKDTRLYDLLRLCEGISDPWAVAKFNETCARISFRTPLTANIFRLKNKNAKLNGNLIRVHKSIIEID